MVIYPEGTRSRNPSQVYTSSLNPPTLFLLMLCDVFCYQLLPFKNGAWRFAKEAGVPILPVCIQGSQDALSHLWIAAPANLVLTYSEPFYVTDEPPHDASIKRVSEWMGSIVKS